MNLHHHHVWCRWVLKKFLLLLQVQRHLQLRIEAQGKYLQSILEKAKETLAGHTSTSPGLKAAHEELTELASKVAEPHEFESLNLLNPPELASSQLAGAADHHPQQQQQQQQQQPLRILNSDTTSSPKSYMTHLHHHHNNDNAHLPEESGGAATGKKSLRSCSPSRSCSDADDDDDDEEKDEEGQE